MKRTKKRLAALRGVLWVLLAAALLLCFWLAVGRVDAAGTDRGRQQLERTLRRAAVACYSADGVYPDTLEELAARCGLQIDEERYTVFYDIFAENLMPDITVLEKGS